VPSWARRRHQVVLPAVILEATTSDADSISAFLVCVVLLQETLLAIWAVARLLAVDASVRPSSSGLVMVLERGAADLYANRRVMGVPWRHGHQEVRAWARDAVSLVMHLISQMLLEDPLVLRLHESLLLLVQGTAIVGNLSRVQVIRVRLRLRGDVLNDRVVHLHFGSRHPVGRVIQAMVQHLVGKLIILEVTGACSALVAVVGRGIAGRSYHAHALTCKILSLVLATRLLDLLAPVHHLGLLCILLVEVHLVVAITMAGSASSAQRGGRSMVLLHLEAVAAEASR